MKIIGLTGGFGTGKTFVASIFRRFGAKVIDADKIAHAVIMKGSSAHRKIVKAFGTEILDKRGNIDRVKLGKMVFENKKKLQRLNRIVHPEVIRVIKNRLKSFGDQDIAVIDAPLLIEAGLAGIADKVIVVKCSRVKQIERCGAKFRIEKEEISKRIKNQIPLKKKIRIADFVIDNSRTKSRTTDQARKVWRQIAWR